MHDEDIVRVLKSAGAREKPPADFEGELRDRLYAEWQTIVAARRHRRQRRMSVALAAGVAAAAIGAWMAAPWQAGPGEAVGTVTLAAGEIRVKSGLFSGWNAVAQDQTLTTGQELETGASGRGALTLPGGVSARLDSNTRLVLTGTDEIVLDRGALYVDATPSNSATSRLEVKTPSGSVHHIGTQYEVRLVGSAVRLRVREGRVEWQSKSGGVEQSAEGEQLTIATDGSVQRQATARYGESWDWIAATTPGLEIEGLPLADFLSWAARELGREVQFDRPETAGEAGTILLHGSISGLTPEQALAAVLATTHFRADLADGRVVVYRQASGN